MAKRSETVRRSSQNIFVPIIATLANVLSYVLFLVAARLLDRATYGETLALLNLILIATIPSFAIQTVIARRTATGTVPFGAIRASLAVGFGGGAVIALCAPLIAGFLYIDTNLGVYGAALAVPALAVLGIALGAAQGRLRWRWLCIALGLMGFGRVGGGMIGLLLTHDSSGALIGTGIGLSVAAALCLREAVRMTYETPPTSPQRIRRFLHEVAYASHAHGAFLLLSSLDLVLARHVLSPEDAGLYAAGAVIFKAALWLPQPVSLMLFADLSIVQRHRNTVRRGLLFVGGLATLTITAFLVLGNVAAFIVGGTNYSDLGSEAWLFAVAGAGFALTQFGLYAGLSMLRRGRLTFIWACVVGEVVASEVLGTGTTPRQFITVVAILSVATTVASIIAALRYDPIKNPPRFSGAPMDQAGTGVKITDPL